MNGALLIHKQEGISSFGVIEQLQSYLTKKSNLKRRDLPKLGHGGTLDPFATGLLIVLVGRGVKLARYFLGSTKAYSGVIRFGETTVPGDPTSPISETSTNIPESIEGIRELAHRLTLQPYLQTPPMHSAKKKNGRPLYELAREGIEVEREPKLCHLYRFEILNYAPPQAEFQMACSSGTYVRTLTQDYSKLLGTVGLLNSLCRTSSGIFDLSNAWTLDQISNSLDAWDQLPCWVPFNRLLDGYDRAIATDSERQSLVHGKQGVLFDILKRIEPAPKRSSLNDHCVAIYNSNEIVAIARKEQDLWNIERVFT